MILRELTFIDRAAFVELIDSWDGALGHSLLYDLVAGADFLKYLDLLKATRDGINLLEGQVPASGLFAFHENKIIGLASVRHEINPDSHSVGGHIGYGVLPAHRNIGVGSDILKQSLAYCHQLGLSKVLITCDSENLASIKVILKNGGIREDIHRSNECSPNEMRFWIQL